ncbi:hypothetical protein MS3_00004169 [Schistosoma haematobium]|uniref:Uncharacterized protein n=1 Tax=Schistosoma haematobium TaxID=6185 RepID=A0A094ZKD3_SCHHA|nr:hypothetical protein MS3_00004169 [Schistosoma haematobium]KAH9592140.1 hypothetical protein MS3_00004169 [Schistosoma haematobium]CAH8675605.1 unnamed protein product [Schistosoma haematobium]CAH8679292.1 unnamed protein product [Schistosoma haematobium]
MHNERRSFRSNLDSNIADTIRVVACKQNQDLRITFANDYACSDRPRPTGSKVAYSASGSGLRETSGHKMHRQAVTSAHKGPQLNRNYGNDATFVATPLDSHTQVSYGSANRRPLINKSEFDYQNNRRSIHGMHSINKDQEQYNRDLMTQYEINRALFLANPPPSVLGSRNRGRGNNSNKVNDSRRIDIEKHSLNQPLLNGSRMDRSTVFRSTLDQQRSVFPSKSIKERGFYNLDSEHDGREALSKNSRGLTRHSRVHFQNNFHRGQGLRQYWGHDDRFENHENTPGLRVQNSFHNGDSKIRHHSGDEYIDDLTPEDIAKYKLEINMDKQPRSLHHHYQHQHRPNHHYYNPPNNRYYPPHHKQPQKNYSNAHYTQLYNSSRKEPVRSNNKIRGSYSSGYNTKQYQTDEKNKPRCSTNNDKIPVSGMNISEDNQVGTDEPIQTNDPTGDSPYFELDFASGIFDVQIHERARSFLTLGIDDSELSQSDCYTNISELNTHGMHRSHSLPSLRDLERNYQPHSFEDCTTPTISLNTEGVVDLSTEVNAVTTSVEKTNIKSDNNVNISSENVCGSDVAQ